MNKKILAYITIILSILFLSYITITTIHSKEELTQNEINGKDITKEEYIYKEDLLHLGYKIDEIDIIEKKISNIDVKKYLLKEKYDYITKYIENNYFNIENIDRYNSYHKKNTTYDINTIIMNVEMKLDYEFYENIEEVTDLESITVLVNKYNKIPDNKVISNLVKLDKKYSKRGLSLKKEAADAVMKLMDAATKENLKLDIISAYRTHDYQNTLFTNSTKKNGINYALKYSAKKYHSEHELGLAVDFNTTQEKFKKTKEYAWLKDNSYKYGFIERYKKGKEYITGYGYEPWHYRYVGTTAALKIYIEDITLEEYKIKYE